MAIFNSYVSYLPEGHGIDGIVFFLIGFTTSPGREWELLQGLEWKYDTIYTVMI